MIFEFPSKVRSIFTEHKRFVFIVTSVVGLNIFWSILFFDYVFRFFPGVVRGQPFYTFSPLIYSLNMAGFFVASTIVIGTCGFVGWKLSWRDFDNGAVRWVTFGVGLILAVKFGFHEYNYYFNQAHYLDRLILLGSGLALYFTPSVLGLFLLQLSLQLSQLYYPLEWGYINYTHLAYFFLVLVFAYLPVKAYTKCRDRIFIILALTFVGANYFDPALRKIFSGPSVFSWVNHRSLEYFNGLMAFKGWFNLNFLSSEVFGVLAPVLLSLVLLLELLALFMAAGPLWSIGLLSAFIVFHGMVFLLTGILFWPWILVEVGLILILIYEIREGAKFTFATRIISVVLIVATPFLSLFRTIPLSFYDTKYNYTLEFRAIDGDGESSVLKPVEFAPYQKYFYGDYSLLKYLVDGKILPTQTSDFESARVVNESLESGMGLETVKEKYGYNYYNRASTERFGQFLRRYVKNKTQSERGDILGLGETLRYVYHDYGVVEKLTPERDIVSVEVWLKEAIHKDGKNTTINKRRIRSFKIR